MVRPCFLVIDREFASSISTRKLVIETAKMNVITAYSSSEAIETLRAFPAVSGIVMDANMKDMHCNDLCAALRELSPSITIIAISGPAHDPCDGADHLLETFEPARLLELLKSLHPVVSAEIEKRNESLATEQH